MVGESPPVHGVWAGFGRSPWGEHSPGPWTRAGVGPSTGRELGDPPSLSVRQRGVTWFTRSRLDLGMVGEDLARGNRPQGRKSPGPWETGTRRQGDNSPGP